MSTLLRKVGRFVKDAAIEFKDWAEIGQEANKTVKDVAESIKILANDQQLKKFNKNITSVFKNLTKGAKG